MTPIDYALWGAGTAAATALIGGAAAKAKEIKQGQGLNRSAQNVERHVALVMRKLNDLQKTISKNFPKGMTDEETQAFYMDRHAEFAQLTSELKVLSRLAIAGDKECEEVIKIAKERASHWKISLFITENCPIL